MPLGVSGGVKVIWTAMDESTERVGGATPSGAGDNKGMERKLLHTCIHQLSQNVEKCCWRYNTHPHHLVEL